MTPLRVLQFITPAGFYGAERWVLALANNMPHDRVVCDLAVTREDEHQDLSVAEYYPPEAGEVHYLPMNGRFDIRVVNQLVDVIRHRRIQVIHTHGYKSDILGLLAAKRAGIPCVSTPHGFSTNVSLKLGMFVRIGTFMLRYFDAVAPLSEELMADMQRFGVPTERTHFIRNGVDLREIDEFAETPKKEPSEEAESTRTLGFAGQLIPRKGIHDLLDIFERLYKQDSGLKLQLLGDGHQRQELEDKAASMTSGKAIEFLGFRNDRLDILLHFDLFVMTSSLEGIPRCMMEAMALGVPVVAYDIPGVDKLVEHEKTGLLAPFGDKDALTDCCQRLLSDPGLARQLTASARAMIEERFSAARMAREYEILFTRLTGTELHHAPSGEKVS